MNSIREKEKQSRKLWIGALQLLNVILITAVFSVGWLKYYWRLLSTPYFQMGIAVLILIFALLYIVPFAASIRFAIKVKDFGLLMFLGTSFVLLILVIWHYSPAYMFILAFEYSFMGYDHALKVQEIEQD